MEHLRLTPFPTSRQHPKPIKMKTAPSSLVMRLMNWQQKQQNIRLCWDTFEINGLTAHIVSLGPNWISGLKPSVKDETSFR